MYAGASRCAPFAAFVALGWQEYEVHLAHLVRRITEKMRLSRTIEWSHATEHSLFREYVLEHFASHLIRNIPAVRPDIHDSVPLEEAGASGEDPVK